MKNKLIFDTNGKTQKGDVDETIKSFMWFAPKKKDGKK